MLLEVVAWPFRGVAQFSWMSPMATGDIHVIKLVLVFLRLICLLSQGDLSQEPRRVQETLFFRSPILSHDL